jgi:2-dehydro-3-deoxygluconokinase
MVVTDEEGERSFIYWRSDSAAKLTFSLLSKEQLAKIKEANIVFLSGISLAILLPEQREMLWALIKEAKQSGAKIIFDPNYRPHLWESKEIAQQQTIKAFELSDQVLPGVEDLTGLFGKNTVQECLDYCAEFSFEEVILKQGADSVHVVNKYGHEEIKIKPSDNVVDTTSAGDAFNGLYLGSRLQNFSVKQSVEFANYGACQVIATPGAIMPKSSFLESWAKLNIS